MNERQQQQHDFDKSQRPLIVGDVNQCPLPPSELSNIDRDSHYVVETIDSGLTAEIFHLVIDGRDYTLKKRREQAKVKNLDGKYSFLNEVLCRQRFESLKSDPNTAPFFENIISTIYADYRLGIILSPWVDGTHIQRLDARLIRQLFTTLEAIERQGIMEWDLCGGNLLVDSNGKVWLFDFGYMYPFNPLTEFNSNGLADPIFHFVERFETRFFFGWLLENKLDTEEQLALYKTLKEQGVKSYQTKLEWLTTHSAKLEIIEHFSSIITKWKTALACDQALQLQFTLDAFRSHVLDIEDDLHGQSCTPTTLKRIRFVYRELESNFEILEKVGQLFYANAGLSQSKLLTLYKEKYQQALDFQVKVKPSGPYVRR